MKIKTFIALSLTLFIVGIASAADYVTVIKEGNIYDEANAKYITVNQENEDLSVIPGMVFVTTQHTPGWYKIEYSPGLHAFIPDQITSPAVNEVPAGTYELINQPGQKLTIDGNGDNWTAAINGKTYKGEKIENILIFQNEGGNIMFSIVDLGNGPIAITYDNSVTKFF